MAAIEIQLIVETIQTQYEKAFSILIDAIDRYDDALWFDDTKYKSPAWQIVYHLLFYANIYCSPAEKKTQLWGKEKDGYSWFDTLREIKKENPESVVPYSKEDMLEYVACIQRAVPVYLKEMKPAEECWPYWYDENQLEFHINNLRHIQHHTAEIIERHDIENAFSYMWK